MVRMSIYLFPGNFTGTLTLSATISDISDSSRDSSTALSNTFTVDFESYAVNDRAKYNLLDTAKPTLFRQRCQPLTTHLLIFLRTS